MTTELLTDPGHTRGDLQMTSMAVRKGWILPDIPTADGKMSILEALPKKLATIALAGKDERSVVSASKLLMEMKASNDRAEGIDKPPNTEPPQTVVNVGVNVDNRTSDKPLTALQFVERYRQTRLAGQTESGAT